MIRTKVVYDPLTRAEEAGLFERWRWGERDARDELIERHIDLANWSSRTYRLKYPSCELDIYSTAYAALVVAVSEFAPAGPARFATFARTVIRRALRDWLCDEFYLVRVPREEHFRDGHGRDTIDAQHDPAPEYATAAIIDRVGGFDNLDRQDEIQFIRESVSSLPRREAAVIAGRYGIGRPEKSTWALTRQLKIDRKQVEASHARGLDILKERLCFMEPTS